MGFREECDLCGRSIRVVSVKTAINRRDGETVMCKECEDKQTNLKAFYDKHKEKTKAKIDSVIENARKEAVAEFSRIMFEQQELRIKAIEEGMK